MNTPIVSAGSKQYPEDINTLSIGKRLFYMQARYSIEHIYDAELSEELIVKLKEKGVDLFTFTQRSFLQSEARYRFPNEDECIALLSIKSFDDWWNHQIRKEARNMVRKAQKKGIKVTSIHTDDDFLLSAHSIYNETPVRQGRRYVGYGITLEALGQKFRDLEKSEILGAYWDGELIGLLWMVYGDRVSRIRSFVSLIRHRDKAPSNALMYDAVKRCCERGFRFLIYERMGYLQGLDSFKKHNGFKGFMIPRYYIPISTKGALAIKLRFHKEIEYSFSPTVTKALLPLYNFATRFPLPSTLWN